MADRSSGWPVLLRNGAAAVLAPAAVLAVDPAGWYPFGPLKWLLVTTLVLFAAAAAHAVPGQWSTSAVLDRAGLVLVVAMAVAALVGLDPIYAWTGTPERHAGVLIWVLCVATLGIGQTIRLPGALSVGLVVAGVGVGAVAVAETLGWEPAIFDVGARLTGLMGSSAYLGAVAALLLPVMVGIVLTPMHAALRVAAGLGAAGLVVALVGSGARAAWVGVAVAALAASWARRSALARRRALASAMAAATVVGLLVVLVLTPAGSRLTALGDEDAAGGRGRLDEWRVATAVLADHPATGVGPEGYRIAFAEGVDPAYEARHGRDPLPDRAHSAPLDLALAGGPVALGAWAAVLAMIARSAWRALRSGGFLDMGLAAGLVAHWVGQLFLFPLAELEPVAWLLGGVLVASQARPGELRPRGGRWAGGVSRTAAAFAVLALVAGSLGVVADRHAERAASTGSVADAETAARLRPDVLRYHLLLAQLRVEGDEGFVPALAAVDDALRVSPGDPIARFAKARYLVGRAAATEVPAHADEARRYVWDLLADDPLNIQLWSLALTLAASGR